MFLYRKALLNSIITKLVTYYQYIFNNLFHIDNNERTLVTAMSHYGTLEEIRPIFLSFLKTKCLVIIMLSLKYGSKECRVRIKLETDYIYFRLGCN